MSTITPVTPDFSNLAEGTESSLERFQRTGNVAPDFKGATIDRDDPESMGAEPAFSSVYMRRLFL